MGYSLNGNYSQFYLNMISFELI